VGSLPYVLKTNITDRSFFSRIEQLRNLSRVDGVLPRALNAAQTSSNASETNLLPKSGVL